MIEICWGKNEESPILEVAVQQKYGRFITDCVEVYVSKS
jgi:hypothetical protein